MNRGQPTLTALVTGVNRYSEPDRSTVLWNDLRICIYMLHVVRVSS